MCTDFAIPVNNIGKALRAWSAGLGYEYAGTTRFGGNPAEADPFVLCRRNMSDYQGLRRLFPVAMHRLALAGRMDRCIAMRRTG